MQKLFVFLAAILLLTACSNSKTETTTVEKHDSAMIKKDSAANTDGSTVTPPASNGQY